MYDYVFSIDVSDDQPALKLPYNLHGSFLLTHRLYTLTRRSRRCAGGSTGICGQGEAPGIVHGSNRSVHSLQFNLITLLLRPVSVL